MSKHSKLVSFVLENFMAYQYQEVYFDESNIISFKGYNSQGKTTMLRALGVINSSMWSMKQTKFIRHGASHFKLTENFDDGVSIVYSKYASGKSSYEMYKDGNEIFSTIQNGVYTSFKGVPDAVSRYLDLLDGTKINLHLRRGRDDLLLVDTTGKENYEFLSTELKAEELSNATALVKTDRLKVKQEIQSLQYEIEGYRNLVKKESVVTPRLVQYLEEADGSLTKNQELKLNLESIVSLISEFNLIRPSVHLQGVSFEKINDISSIINTIGEYNKVRPTVNLDKVNEDKFTRLQEIIDGMQYLGSFRVLPTIEQVGMSKEQELRQLLNSIHEYNSVVNKIEHNNESIRNLKDELASAENFLKESGAQIIKCKSCGELQTAEHVH